MNNIKESVVATYVELFTRGEMLKGWRFINTCVPQELEADVDIRQLRTEANNRLREISEWSTNGRPYPGSHSTEPFDSFPKFVLAEEIIKEQYPDGGSILDIGCYSGVFINKMSTAGYKCCGTDVHKELMSKLNTPDHSFIFAPTHQLPFEDGSFDIVTAFDVLEHVMQLSKTLSEMDRVCKKGGLVIINLPQMTDGYKDEAFEHVRMFGTDDITRLWGDRDGYRLLESRDEHGRPTSFILYRNN